MCRVSCAPLRPARRGPGRAPRASSLRDRAYACALSYGIGVLTHTLLQSPTLGETGLHGPCGHHKVWTPHLTNIQDTNIHVHKTPVVWSLATGTTATQVPGSSDARRRVCSFELTRQCLCLVHACGHVRSCVPLSVVACSGCMARGGEPSPSAALGPRRAYPYGKLDQARNSVRSGRHEPHLSHGKSSLPATDPILLGGQ